MSSAMCLAPVQLLNFLPTVEPYNKLSVDEEHIVFFSALGCARTAENLGSDMNN